MIRIAITGGLTAGLASLAVATSAQPIPTQPYPFKAGPVTIESCSFGQSGNAVAANSLEIKYFQNIPRRHLVSVTFRVRYAGRTATFTDTGRFSYGATIDHKFDQLGGTPWVGPNPSVCRVTNATFGDGESVAPPYGGDASGGADGPPPDQVPSYAEPPRPAPSAT